MTCERTKRERIRFLGARPSEIKSFDARRIVRAHPELLRDRVAILEPTWICSHIGESAAPVECAIALCSRPATFECDGCDIPICAEHANHVGYQTLQAETGFASPGWSRIEYEDTYDLCPLCLFNGPPEIRRHVRRMWNERDGA